MFDAQLSVNDSARVVVADDQVLVRAGIAALLGEIAGFACVASVSDGAACLRACAELQPDILLLDLNLPDCNGLDIAARLRHSQPQLRVVILTSQTDADSARRALALGVRGYVSKDFVLDELAMALRQVQAGRAFLSPDVALGAVRASADAAADAAPAVAAVAAAPPLSPRQREVLRGIARGQSNKLLARELGLSVKTVEYHRAELIQRLDLHDVASLTRFAVAHGLV